MGTIKIVITGGPGTGKSSLINKLQQYGYHCFEEISRQVTLQARSEGIEQLFLTDPLLFSQKLLEGRQQQFIEAQQSPKDLVFLDRGLPDVLAYMDFVGDTYPDHFKSVCQSHQYEHIFVLSPWQEIFVQDTERYESFEDAIAIHHCLLDTYRRFGYQLIDVPFDSIENRVTFILNALNL
ncbi:MAG: ATP-binding protein [Winogradskyella sp.]|nr:ATP-binding protein [Winogradskyella sp.]